MQRYSVKRRRLGGKGVENQRAERQPRDGASQRPPRLSGGKISEGRYRGILRDSSRREEERSRELKRLLEDVKERLSQDSSSTYAG